VERLPPGSPATAWRNRLIHGENLAALTALTAELKGRVDLIYIDPPFATGADFSLRAEVGGRRRSAEPARTVSTTAYRDGWGPGRIDWFSMMADRLELARELLSETGTIYVHVDWNAGHHLRPLMDEIFGEQNSLGEVVWAYGSPSGGRAAGRKLVKAHDFILVFAKTYGEHQFHPVWLPYSERYLADWFKFQEPDGRRYRKRWRRAKDGTSYFEKQYLEDSKGVPASTVWTDIQQVYADPRAYKAGMASEVTGYPTQKPVKLLERILALSTGPSDLVLDFFSGSGTTLVAAERMGRRWIGCDAQAAAVHLAARRLLGLPEVRPFDLERLDGDEGAQIKKPPSVRFERSSRGVRAELSDDTEQIERWSLGREEGALLMPAWTTFRTLKNRELPQQSPWLAWEGEAVPTVELVDVVGATARKRG
jgi:adenine-specific DNA-methyltransferase